MTIHYFHSTGEAYNACQTRDDIKTGDILVVEREGVVGIADAWPLAVTYALGYLHQTLTVDVHAMRLYASQAGWPTGVVDLALKTADEYGFARPR